MGFRGSVQKHIRGEETYCQSSREKLKTKPESLNELNKIVHENQKIYEILNNYYSKKGLQ